MKTRIIALLFAAAALPLAAQTTPRVDARQAAQESRIQQGTQSGALTGREAAKLERGQDKVQAMEGKAKADGRVTPRERARLAKEQNKQSRNIAKQKHDKQRKAPAS
jgi:uncharacterized membrane protein YebE (DUF533 family)